ncbi:MAG: hypothetical protein GEU90_13815 [Gemmatimonas sp.]|nr:hypothetical protein [Gemmatimonas sp.]
MMLPFHLTDDGRAATWNPALTRATHVLINVRSVDGNLEVRRSMNSGRARVRVGERIESIRPAGHDSSIQRPPFDQ